MQMHSKLNFRTNNASSDTDRWTTTFIQTIALVIILTVMTILSGCGQPSQFVTGASVSTNGSGTQTMVNVSLDIQTNGLNLPAFQIPVYNPQNTSELLGYLMAEPLLSGDRITISVNLNAIIQIQNLDGHFLPNGFPIPVAGLNDITVIGIPIAGTGSVIYVALDKDKLVVGSAINIKEFSQLSPYVGGLNFFPSFNLGNGIKGVAGIYTSPQGVGKNGIAFFVDASSVLPKLYNEVPLYKTSTSDVSTIKLISINPSPGKEKTLGAGLNKLRQKMRGRPVTLSL